MAKVLARIMDRERVCTNAGIMDSYKGEVVYTSRYSNSYSEFLYKIKVIYL